jgi:hypothetical protein
MAGTPKKDAAGRKVGRSKKAGQPFDPKAIQAEEARESAQRAQAKNAQASIRTRMVKIGRGNQQAGRG